MSAADETKPAARARRQDPLSTGLESVLGRVAPNADGELASYIPELAGADPASFGIALVSMDGHAYGAGDAHVPFTIQSISKPFVYALALMDHGLDTVLECVGVEPSGRAFNAISIDQNGRPANPLVNAGALMTTSLVRAQYPEERFERILTCLSAFAGRRLEVDETVYRSELSTASRNRALAYLMESAGSLQQPVEEVLDVYCRQCAVTVTATDLAMMAATLGAGGVNPLSGDAVIDEATAERTLGVMATCGMYDFSGEWLMRIGLPAKSGVAGGLIAVSPSEFGIGVFSPPLDARGNSVRGIAVARELADRFDLHLMHHPGDTAPVVYLNELEVYAGRRAVAIAAQGVVEFSAAEQVVFAIRQAFDDAEEAADALLLDLHRVTRTNAIAEQLLRSELAGLADEGILVAIVQQEHLPARLPPGDRVALFTGRDEAGWWLEARCAADSAAAAG